MHLTQLCAGNQLMFRGTVRRKSHANRRQLTQLPGPAKTVNVDLVSLRGSTRDAPADLDFANTVFAPCCVHFTMANGGTVDAANSDKWLGGDTVITTGTCVSATSEELDTTTELRHCLGYQADSAPFMSNPSVAGAGLTATRRTVPPAPRHPFPVWRL